MFSGIDEVGALKGLETTHSDTLTPYTDVLYLHLHAFYKKLTS